MRGMGIIVAFSKEEVSMKMKRMLESGGHNVEAVCRSAADIVRTAADTECALVIMGQRLPDGTADDVYNMLDGIPIIAAAKPDKLSLIENEQIILMPLPTNSSEILKTVALVTQPRRRGSSPVRKRSEEDEKLINKAKLYLMETYMMTEEQAHRFIQKRSMDMGTRFEETARMILS